MTLFSIWLTNSLWIPSTMEHFLLHHAVQFLARLMDQFDLDTALQVISLPQLATCWAIPCHRRNLLTSTWTAPSSFSKVCATELTLHWNKIIFHVYTTWQIWNTNKLSSSMCGEYNQKISERKQCGNSKRSIRILLQPNNIEPTYIFNFLYSKKLCIYLCTTSMRLVLPIWPSNCDQTTVILFNQDLPNSYYKL